jgi:hypothetical protein
MEKNAPKIGQVRRFYFYWMIVLLFKVLLFVY